MKPFSNVLLAMYNTMLCLILCANNGDSETIIGVLLILTNSSSQYPNYVNSLESVENAVNEVNQRNDLLFEYTLEINSILITEEVSGGSSIHFSDSFFNSSSPTVGIINGGYSYSSFNLLELLSIPIISYSPLNIIKNVDSVRSISLTLSGSNVVNAINEFVEYAGWRQVALISEPNEFFINIEQLLMKKLTKNGIKVNEFHVSRTQENISYLYEGSNKILILNTFEDVARNILCEAYKSNAYYPEYQWILYGWYNEDWLLQTVDDNIACTTEELMIVTERAIMVEQENITGCSKHLCAATNSSLANQTKYFENNLAHDSVIALAMYLNDSISNDAMFIDKCGIYNKITRQTFTKCTTTAELADTEFQGQSGHVSFDNNGGRNANSIYYSQYRKGNELCTERVQIALLVYNNLSLNLIGNEDNTTIWPDGIPYDGSPIQIISLKLLSATIVLYILATVGLIFTLTYLIFNIVFRKRKVIRLTSPNLNYFIIVGATILYGSIYLRMARTSSTNFWVINCHAIIWTLYIGYGFCLSPYVGKLWRLYYICHNPTTKKKKIQDWHLVVFVVVEVSIVTLMLIASSLIPYARPQFYLGDDLENRNFTNENGIQVHFVSVNCFSTLSFLLNAFGIVFFSVHHIIAIYFALKIRKSKIKILNEYRELSATLYITTVAMVQGLAFSVILQNYETIVESFVSSAIFISTTMFVGFAFIPKVRSLYKDPQGNNIFRELTTETGNITALATKNNGDCMGEQIKIKTLKDEIVELNQKLIEQTHHDES